MDLNQLFYNHQVALIKRAAPTCAINGKAQFDLVSYYSNQIREFREDAGLPRYKWHELAKDQIVAVAIGN